MGTDLLEMSYKTECLHTVEMSKLVYLSNYIFGFVTYDDVHSELLAKKAIEVCDAINENKTFSYIENSDNELWFLIMCNMPFFYDKITWGCSIRGAFWENKMSLKSCGLYKENGRQMIGELQFNRDEWHGFVNDLIQFATDGKNG